LEEEISRQNRDYTHLSVLLIDLDFFKKVNDTYGHQQGDKVLTEFADILKKRCRLSDICGRIGGEEFGVILPNTNVGGAIRIAETIREITEKHLFQKLDGKGSVSITVSIGVTSSPPEKVLTASRFYNRIDKVLYKAKETGRNRVVYE
jgi:diguanylate cyclase (GGDEF)-like protein